MLDEFPETLVSIEWHSPSFTPGGSDFDLPSEYSQRGGMYGVGGIPHTMEWCRRECRGLSKWKLESHVQYIHTDL